jgi:mono/diheme cytochrome c family protein
MRPFLLGVLSALLVAVLVGAIAWLIVSPRVDWGATRRPGPIENALAQRVIARWIAHSAPAVADPILPTPENLESGREEYKEHCAPCHGLDGSGHDQFEADFLPRIPRLTGKVQELSDAELYFVISNGIRNTAMPGFQAHHSPDEIWKTILWLRHLAHLTPEERMKIMRETSDQERGHEETMTRGRANAHLGTAE